MNLLSQIHKIEKLTYADKGLWLKGMLDEVECKKYHEFDEQEITFSDNSTFMYIRTYSSILESDKDILGSIPYCVSEDIFVITLPKFGELSREDIEKAILYVINKVLDIWKEGFEIYYDGEKV